MSDVLGRTLDFLRGRKRAYQLALKSPAGNEVLIDLARFCRANETCIVTGDRESTLVLEGRREVWLRIQQHLNLSSEELMQLYQGRSILKPTEQDDG